MQYNLVHSFSHIETYTWKRVTTSGTPLSPRDSHTCSSWKNKIIVTGGEDEQDYHLSHVHVLEIGNCCILLYKYYNFGALTKYLCKKGDIYRSRIY